MNLHLIMRTKIAINFFDKKTFIKTYQLDDANPLILIIANFILQKINNINTNDLNILNFMQIIKTYNFNKFGIKIVCKKDPINFINSLYILYNELINIFNIQVFCYQYQNDIIYLTNDIYLNDVFDNIQWNYQIDSFIQGDFDVGNKIHTIVNNMMLRNNYNLLAIGGESGYYAKANYNYLNKIVCINGYQINYHDYVYNLGIDKAKLIKYEEIIIKDYVNDNNWILLINNRNNPDILINQIIQQDYSFNQIIYIGCKIISVEKDNNILKTKYKIHYKEIINDIHLIIYLT